MHVLLHACKTQDGSTSARLQIKNEWKPDQMRRNFGSWNLLSFFFNYEFLEKAKELSENHYYYDDAACDKVVSWHVFPRYSCFLKFK